MEQFNVEKKQWEDYFDNFSKRNSSRLICLEISDETGSYRPIKKMPLSGVALDENGVEIMLENRRYEENHYSHLVKNPANIVKNITLDGRDEGMFIVDSNGKTTKLFFEHLPELVAHPANVGIW
jgi:Family of unknown function (DUF5335)